MIVVQFFRADGLHLSESTFDFRKSEILQYLGVFCIMFGLIAPFVLWIVCIVKESKYKQLKKHQMQTVKNILPVENGTIESASGDHDESSDQT